MHGQSIIMDLNQTRKATGKLFDLKKLVLGIIFDIILPNNQAHICLIWPSGYVISDFQFYIMLT